MIASKAQDHTTEPQTPIPNHRDPTKRNNAYLVKI
jgi:hypothetical protein